MKRILIAAAAALALTAVSCDKEPGGKDPTTGKQEVTITCGQEGTKVAGVADTDGKVSFKWQTGDYLYVTEGTLSPTYFAIKSGAESQKAKFSGEVSEEAGESTKFSIQWPDNKPAESSSFFTQTYVSGGIQGEKMLATAEVTGLSTLKSSNIELAPQYAVVRLSLKGDLKIKTVKLTTVTDGDTYTLNCPSVQLSESAATYFYIVAKPTSSQTVRIELVDGDDNEVGPFNSVAAVKAFTKGVTLKLGDLTIYKDGTFSSTDFNAANWNSHESGGTGAGDFTGETW